MKIIKIVRYSCITNYNKIHINIIMNSNTMSQNILKKQQKVSYTSPVIQDTAYTLPTRKHKSSLMSKQDFGFDQISEDKDQHKISPKQNKQMEKTKSNSYNQIGVAQCKVFENKIRLKQSQKMKNLPISNTELTQIQNIEQSENKLNFALQYRLNLRRTVYNETKMMIKERKNKIREKFYSIDNGLKKQSSISMKKQLKNQTQFKLKIKKSLQHPKKSKFQTKKTINNIDSMYKTITTQNINPFHQKKQQQARNKDLGISKFPLINRAKNQNNINFSNLLMTLQMRQNLLSKQRFKSNLSKCNSIKKNHFQKQQINPWETFADQFTD